MRQNGIYFQDNYKSLSNGQRIYTPPLPKKVMIPLLQHKGMVASVLVKQGDKVQTGDCIGEQDGHISSRIHASISGTVESICEVTLFNGVCSPAVIIKRDEDEEEVDYLLNKEDWKSKSPEDLIQMIQDAGVVGLGGATFPTHVKLSPNETINTLVVNGAECEPYITCDEKNLEEAHQAVLEGIEIVCSILNIKDVKIGIERDNQKTLNTIQSLFSKKENFEVVGLDSSYPQGDEKLLIQSCTGRLVPLDTLPAALGVLVLNVSTLKAIQEAVVYKKPLIERVVTVSGQGIEKPVNILSRIGTPISELVKFCGGFSERTRIILVGGPMMGFAQSNLNTPVIKGSLGVLALEEELPNVPEEELKCIRCSRCIDACAFGIQPQLLYHLIRNDKLKKAEKHFLFYCKECGACDYVCPAKIPLLSYFKRAKKNLR